MRIPSNKTTSGDSILKRFGELKLNNYHSKKRKEKKDFII